MILNGLPPLEEEMLPANQRLPVLLLSQYLHFLSRRPISESNLHFLLARLRGLQSLEPVFAGSGHPVLERLVRQLRQLHPSAFRRVAAALQLSLIPLTRGARTLPEDVVVQDSAPPPGWLAGVRHALIVFGPGIGIGDELMLAPLPRWMKQVTADLSISTLSAYTGFWERVPAVDRHHHYSSHLDLLQALRGGAPHDTADIVVFVDFESPELYRGIAADGGPRRYLEVSVGSRSAFLFDPARRRLFRVHHITPYYANFYHALHQTLRSLGFAANAATHFDGVVRRDTAKASDRLDVFVTPFTSKYDPSAAYWGRLLTRVARYLGPYPVRFHLDTGNTWRTRRFAIELARAVAAARPPNVDVRLAQDRTPPSLSLPGVYAQLDRCHAVICADSFAAHAGPLFDCLTLVLAKPDLKHWQVPFDRSFYFDPAWPIDRVTESMGTLVHEIRRPKTAAQVDASFSKAELDLSRWGSELAGDLQRGDLDDGFADLYRQFAERYQVVVETRQRSDAGTGIFAGSFGSVIRGPDADWQPDADAGMTHHLRDQVERWQNTNFAKYVRQAASRAPEQRADDETDGGDDGSWSEAPASSRLASVLVGGMKALLREQLPSGEMPTYFRVGGGALEYRRTPLLSAFVHDALGTFDLRARWVDTDFLDALPSGTQGRFVRAATLVRARIRRFLLWEETNEGGWRFDGRSSGIAADADTTACAAAAAVQAPRRKPHPRHRAHADLLRQRLAAPTDGDGSFVARVNALRFLALLGEPVEDLVPAIVAELRDEDRVLETGRYVHPLVTAFLVARAWAQGALPGRTDVAELLVPRILARADDPPNFGGPLGTALALNALLDLEYTGEATIGGAQYLLDSALPRGGWTYAAFLENGGGAPAFSTAFAMSALARSGVAR
jgi:hypothetical protein